MMAHVQSKLPGRVADLPRRTLFPGARCLAVVKAEPGMGTRRSSPPAARPLGPLAATIPEITPAALPPEAVAVPARRDVESTARENQACSG
jgi:hypothetical protein